MDHRTGACRDIKLKRACIYESQLSDEQHNIAVVTRHVHLVTTLANINGWIWLLSS